MGHKGPLLHSIIYFADNSIQTLSEYPWQEQQTQRRQQLPSVSGSKKTEMFHYHNSGDH